MIETERFTPIDNLNFTIDFLYNNEFTFYKIWKNTDSRKTIDALFLKLENGYMFFSTSKSNESFFIEKSITYFHENKFQVTFKANQIQNLRISGKNAFFKILIPQKICIKNRRKSQRKKILKCHTVLFFNGIEGIKIPVSIIDYGSAGIGIKTKIKHHHLIRNGEKITISGTIDEKTYFKKEGLIMNSKHIKNFENDYLRVGIKFE